MSLEAVRELLKKQKLVEGMVHNQAMPRHDIVETLVHRQHLTELGTMMASLPASEIGEILEALPEDDARLLWKKIPEGRISDILWEMPESLRERLALSADTDTVDCQISAYELVEGRLKRHVVSSRRDLENLKPVWIDLVNAGEIRRAHVGEFFGLELPDPGVATDLEVSTRFHVEENDEIHLHSNFLADRTENSRSVPVAFILHRGVLFSLRNEELPVFRLQRLRARMSPGYVSDSYDLLLDLYGADVEYSADSLEGIYRTLNDVGKQVLSESMSDREAAGVLAGIAEVENLNGQVRSNILDTQRALTFLMQRRILSPNQIGDANQILRNIDSLNSHTAFLFDKINFLMDATIGFININQNRRVSQLTAFGVVFMPLNIIAGIGGMSEFTMMTEGIPWPLAYGVFTIGMGLVGVGMYVALKHFENRRARQAIAARKAVRP
jgi:magnesium transporter